MQAMKQSGIAVYECDPVSGLLRGIRICENVGKEDDCAYFTVETSFRIIQTRAGENGRSKAQLK